MNINKKDYTIKKIVNPFCIIRKKQDGNIQYIINKQIQKEDGSYFVISFFCTELEYKILDNLMYEINKEVIGK